MLGCTTQGGREVRRNPRMWRSQWHVRVYENKWLRAVAATDKVHRLIVEGHKTFINTGSAVAACTHTRPLSIS
jgi:hypothetical protein